MTDEEPVRAVGTPDGSDAASLGGGRFPAFDFGRERVSAAESRLCGWWSADKIGVARARSRRACREADALEGSGLEPVKVAGR